MQTRCTDRLQDQWLVTIGIPQCWVLEPMLLTVFTNNLDDSSKHSRQLTPKYGEQSIDLRAELPLIRIRTGQRSELTEIS